MVNIVIIGYGRIAQNHIAAINALDDVKLVGICDHTEDKVMKVYNLGYVKLKYIRKKDEV